jgi:hypothetical protein
MTSLRLGESSRKPALIVKAKPTLILILVFYALGSRLAQAQPAKVTGNWNVEITFTNGNIRLLCFEAQDAGKGSFLLLDPSLKVWGPARTSEAKWSQGDDGSVTFSGPVEFPLGNVGRDAGTLILKGKFQADGTITGKATFSPVRQDGEGAETKPSKDGSFKATRSAGR